MSDISDSENRSHDLELSLSRTSEDNRDHEVVPSPMGAASNKPPVIHRPLVLVDRTRVHYNAPSPPAAAVATANATTTTPVQRTPQANHRAGAYENQANAVYIPQERTVSQASSRSSERSTGLGQVAIEVDEDGGYYIGNYEEPGEGITDYIMMQHISVNKAVDWWWWQMMILAISQWVMSGFLFGTYAAIPTKLPFLVFSIALNAVITVVSCVFYWCMYLDCQNLNPTNWHDATSKRKAFLIWATLWPMIVVVETVFITVYTVMEIIANMRAVPMPIFESLQGVTPMGQGLFAMLVVSFCFIFVTIILFVPTTLRIFNHFRFRSEELKTKRD